MVIVRTGLGIVAGSIVWMVGFFTLARLLFLVWPAYAARAQVWIDSGTYDFATAMSVFNIVFWLLAEIGAGWIAVFIARRREAAWVLAALVMLYMCFNHLYYFWDRFPWWYNLAVALPSGLAVFLGGKLADRWVRRSPANEMSMPSGAERQ
jgi:hypothetical protein